MSFIQETDQKEQYERGHAEDAVDGVEEQGTFKSQLALQETGQEKRQGDEERNIDAQRQNEIAGDKPGRELLRLRVWSFCLSVFFRRLLLLASAASSSRSLLRPRTAAP